MNDKESITKVDVVTLPISKIVLKKVDDNTDIWINPHLIPAYKDKGKTISISINNEWVDVNISMKELIIRVSNLKRTDISNPNTH